MTIPVIKPGPRWPCRHLCPLCRYLESFNPTNPVNGDVDNYASDVYWCQQHPAGNGLPNWEGVIVANDPEVMAVPWMIRASALATSEWYDYLRVPRMGLEGEFRTWLMGVLIHHRLMDLPEPTIGSWIFQNQSGDPGGPG